MNKFSNMRYLPFYCFTTLFIAFLFNFPSLATASFQQDLLSPGSSISVEDNSNMLVSSNGLFSCGFYKVGVNAFTFAIWVNQSISRTVVWTANRGVPVNGRGSRIELRRDGTVVLLDYNSRLVWSTGATSKQVRGAQLLGTGNLVLFDPHGSHLWQSFDWPTDTILPTQPIPANMKLLSGKYMLSVDGNILALTYDTPEGRSKYWPRNSSATPSIGGLPRGLDMLGCFSASVQYKYCASDVGVGVLRRLTLDRDGNLRIYSLSETDGSWYISWIALADACQVHGVCGNKGMCLHTHQSKPICTCPRGFVFADLSDLTKGCKPTFSISCDKVTRVYFLRIEDMSFWGYYYSYNTLSLDDCLKNCSGDLHCEAFAYQNGLGGCSLKSSLYSGGFAPSVLSHTYMKLTADAVMQHNIYYGPRSPYLSCQGSDDFTITETKDFQWNYLYMPIVSIFAVEAILLPIAWCFLCKRKQESVERDDGFALIRNHFRKFTFKELVTATATFKHVIGRGGSGIVYKGILDDGKKAVKKLQDMVQGELDFQSELSVIGKIYHMNLVRMWGFCSERGHKLLVFEYVENGSLAKLLFDTARPESLLLWEQRFRIALGVAKGLAYLHHECLEWVVHCDVKPENILLDEELEPKLADFGLVMLMTRGYIAPEWALNLPITGKVDVYSYGVVLLELVRGLRISDWAIDGDEEEEELEMVFRNSVVLLKEKLRRSKERLWLAEFVDSRLNGNFCTLQAATMVELAVACVEEERSRRPNMKDVVEKLLSCDVGNPYVVTHLP